MKYKSLRQYSQTLDVHHQLPWITNITVATYNPFSRLTFVVGEFISQMDRREMPSGSGRFRLASRCLPPRVLLPLPVVLTSGREEFYTSPVSVAPAVPRHVSHVRAVHAVVSQLLQVIMRRL